jgi:GTP-binding protein
MKPFASSRFLASIGKLSQLPRAGPPELAFAGRSNVGKSSALNALTNRRKLAFASKTPGRTQTINFFELGDGARLVDLPGYGYARVPQAVRQQWDKLVGGYLQTRASLIGVVLIMDARHPFSPYDRYLIEWLKPANAQIGPRLLVLLAKCDKLSRQQRTAALASAREVLAESGARGEVRLFSSQTREGVPEAREVLENWLEQVRPGPERGA